VLVRVAADAALVKIGGLAVEPLIGALRDQDEDVRKAAAETLCRIGGLAVEPLIGALRDQSEDVRKAVAEILCRIGDTRAVEPFVAALG
jgi:HEAT repeat protein